MIKSFFKNKFLLLCFVLPFHLVAQKQDRIWLFPDSAGIDFNDLNNPVAIHCNLVPPDVVSTSIADNSGNLLFYAGGVNLHYRAVRIFDKNGSVMLGGDTLIGYPWVGQGNMIIPFPNDTNKFYVFICNRDGGVGNSLRMAIVDMSLNLGLGEVIVRDSLILFDHINEKLNAVKHANGRNWWVLMQSNTTDSLFHEFLITPTGLSGPFDQLIGSGANRNKFFGQMIFSRDGSKLGLVSPNATVDIFDFDRCNGQLSNYKDVGERLQVDSNTYFGCSFSPNGRLFYTSTWYLHQYKNVYQYDLTSPDIKASKQIIFSYQDTGAYYQLGFGAHLLGPDDKIYIAKGNSFTGTNSNTFYTHHIDVITDPNNLGVACNYQPSYFDLGVGRTIEGLPNMLNYNLGPVVGSICDSLSNDINQLHERNDLVSLFPNPTYDKISIRLNSSLIAKLILRNYLGEIVQEKVISDNEQLDLSSLTTGTYIGEFVFGQNIIRKKIVKVE